MGSFKTVVLSSRARKDALLLYENGIVLAMELVLPSVEYKNSFIETVKEFQSDTDYSHRSKWYRGLLIPKLETDFKSFVEYEQSHTRGENIREGYVPYTNYWLVDNGEFIGSVSIRHRLNEHLMQIGGHIGYDIRPSKRQQGYGTKILELALQKAKGLGIERALVTCDAKNIPSRKIIKKNGGILENQVPNPETGMNKLRYWIDIP